MSSPVIFTNPDSGRRETAVEALTESFTGRAEVQATTWDDLATDVARAVAGGARWIGVAGGDGSLRLAAPVLAETGTPLLPVPCGTRNHFAKDAGIATVEDAVRATHGESTRTVALAWVNEECFLNTCSLGMYAAIVRERERHMGRLPKRVADSLGLLRETLGGHRLRLLVDQAPLVTWAIFIGNGRYGDNLGALGRDNLDEGVLDIRILLANQKVARLRLLGALLGRRLDSTAVLAQSTKRTLTVELPGAPSLDVAVDGDVCHLRSPLHIRVEDGALKVLGPPHPETS